MGRMTGTRGGRGALLRRAAATCMAVSAIALAGCSAAPEVVVTAPAPEVVADGLEAPWSLAPFGEEMLVSERDSARVLEISASGEVREVGVIGGVSHGGEGGLLGLAIREGELYSYSTGADGNRVERRPLVGEAGALSLGDPVTVIDGIPSAGTHNGGRIAFGPDGMLYVTTGDAGDRQSAQDVEALSGKILRLEPDGSIPADNPFAGSPVFSYGHRNPQGIGWDRDGAMYASEFGQDTWDELNVIVAGGNYGWPVVEGIADDARYIDPVQQWTPEEASPSGIAVTGSDILVANLRGERVRIVPLDDLGTSTEMFVGEYGRIRDIAVTVGATWYLTNNTDGRGDPRSGDDRLILLGMD
ncbi:MAG: PQQ-dependent sugar dehydrogenase [Microbacterium sp.]|nr:PQQ-dependent sugar dehydrogenase [Microbacterium sp.]